MTVDVADGPADGLGRAERATLAAEIHDLYDGQGDGDRLLAAFRAAALYVPLAEDEAMCSGEADGVRWLYAFTSTAELERFARARLGSGTDPGWEGGRIRYWTVLGSRLLDVAVPAAVTETRAPAGVAVDVGGVRPLLLPPLSGIVPDPVAVDLIDRTSGTRHLDRTSGTGQPDRMSRTGQLDRTSGAGPLDRTPEPNPLDRTSEPRHRSAKEA